MGADVKDEKIEIKSEKVAPNLGKGKPVVDDKKIESKCAGMKKAPAVDDRKLESKCAGKVKAPIDIK
jgi:hypothetical protein